MAADQYRAMQTDLPDDISDYFPPGTSEEEISAIYNNPELFEKYMQDLQIHYSQLQQNYSIYEECALPVVTQAYQQMSQILLYCLILRCLSKMKLNHTFIHFMSIAFGCMSMWKFYGNHMVYVMFPCLLFIPFFQLRSIYRGWLVALVATSYLVACEFFLLDAVDWNKVKGSVMIVLMKIISVAFDAENIVTVIPSNPIELYGYIFNPASIIFGPFLTYKDYLQLFHAHSMDLWWFLHSFRSILLSVVCLLWSSCGTSHFLPQLSTYIPILEGNRWWTAYKEALSFRFSHYFVCYFSESACLVSGIGTVKTEDINTKKENKSNVSENGSDISKSVEDTDEGKGKVEDTVDEKGKVGDADDSSKEETISVNWCFPVANTFSVEMPGSLVDVVTNWNLPMHFWLKNYVYKPTRKYGVFIAILATYIGSSILHGVNFQLSAVLLSIGIFAYIESVTRRLLSSMLDACIEARPCKENCGHTYNAKNMWVMMLNLLFSLIAVWNLAYLGCPFDNSAEEEEGYSMNHALNKWRQYDYINHSVMLVTFITQGIINTGRFF